MQPGIAGFLRVAHRPDKAFQADVAPISHLPARLCSWTLVTGLVLSVGLVAQEKNEKSKKKKDKTAFTLENIFPDKKEPLFGPSAQRPNFSHDGKYAAWLHKTYEERRHGSDLFIIAGASVSLDQEPTPSGFN